MSVYDRYRQTQDPRELSELISGPPDVESIRRRIDIAAHSIEPAREGLMMANPKQPHRMWIRKEMKPLTDEQIAWAEEMYQNMMAAQAEAE